MVARCEIGREIPIEKATSGTKGNDLQVLLRMEACGQSKTYVCGHARISKTRSYRNNTRFNVVLVGTDYVSLSGETDGGTSPKLEAGTRDQNLCCSRNQN